MSEFRETLANLAIWTILAYVVIAFTSYRIGQGETYSVSWTYTVCHSISEDSDLWDCDYRNGAWYRKLDRSGQK